MKIEKGKGGTPYPSLTPALIKDQNKALRYTPRVNEELGQRPKTTRRQTTVAKALLSNVKGRRK